MDDYYLMNPEDLLQAPVADIILDLENPLILEVGTTCGSIVHGPDDPRGALAMCWDRDAHHFGRRTVF